MKSYPNHPRFIVVAEFDARGQYINVNAAPIMIEESTDTTAVYDVRANQTPVLVPHLAPLGKDWLWSADTQTWMLIDDYAALPVYSKSRVEQCLPPLFGDKLTDDMTLKTPPSEPGKITYWDAKADGWAMRDDLTGKQVFNINDPRQSLVLGRDDWATPEGYTDKPAPSAAHVWDKKTCDWVLDKAKQAELDKQAIDAADVQLTCLMSQMCAWLTIESYKPKSEQRGGNILSPVKIDEMLRGLPDSVETDLMRNAWSRATRIEFTSATTQSFAQMLGMSKEQLRIAMTEAKAL